MLQNGISFRMLYAWCISPFQAFLPFPIFLLFVCLFVLGLFFVLLCFFFLGGGGGVGLTKFKGGPKI